MDLILTTIMNWILRPIRHFKDILVTDSDNLTMYPKAKSLFPTIWQKVNTQHVHILTFNIINKINK